MDFLVKMSFVSDTVYLWNGNYPLTIGGNVYQPLHGVGVIDGLQQSANSNSDQVTMTVPGIPGQVPDLLSLALSETPEANQQMCYIYMQLFDDDWQPVGDPILIFLGFMQPPRVSYTAGDTFIGATQLLSIAVENAFYNRSIPVHSLNTDRDQQRRFPGDNFFQFTPSLVNKTFIYPDYG